METEESKITAKPIKKSTLDNNIWLAGMIVAITLIIINLMSFLPRYIDSEAPVIVRDFGKIAISIYHKAAMFGFGSVVYILLLAIFSHYMKRLGLEGVKKALYIIIAAKILTFLSNFYGWYTGAFKVSANYIDSTYFYINSIINIICYIASTCVYFYVAATFLTYRKSLKRYLKLIAVVILLSLGLTIPNLALTISQILTDFKRFGINNHHEYINSSYHIIFIIRGIGYVIGYYVLYILFNIARKKDYIFSSKKS
jgi:hypothetical protein